MMITAYNESVRFDVQPRVFYPLNDTGDAQ